MYDTHQGCAYKEPLGGAGGGGGVSVKQNVVKVCIFIYLWNREPGSRHSSWNCCHFPHIPRSRTQCSLPERNQSTILAPPPCMDPHPPVHSSRPAYTPGIHSPRVRTCSDTPPGLGSCCRCLGNHHRWRVGIHEWTCRSNNAGSQQSRDLGLWEAHRNLSRCNWMTKTNSRWIGQHMHMVDVSFLCHTLMQNEIRRQTVNQTLAAAITAFIEISCAGWFAFFCRLKVVSIPFAAPILELQAVSLATVKVPSDDLGLAGSLLLWQQTHVSHLWE